MYAMLFSEGLIFSKREDDAQYFLERRIVPKIEQLPGQLDIPLREVVSTEELNSPHFF